MLIREEVIVFQCNHHIELLQLQADALLAEQTSKNSGKVSFPNGLVYLFQHKEARKFHLLNLCT